MRIALIGEGSSDRLLIPAVAWLVRQLRPLDACDIVFTDFRAFPSPPDTLIAKLGLTLRQGGWDAVLVHRDSDAIDPEPRYREIAQAAASGMQGTPVVPIVPVRMTEAWLLFDEKAIRRAAGNSSSRTALAFPSLEECARREDPKKILHDALSLASGRQGRRLAKFNPGASCHVMAASIEDWSRLLEVASFQRLRDDLDAALPRPPVR